MNIIHNIYLRFYFFTFISVVVVAKKSILNKCDKCAIFVKSFDYWFEKTSHGKYEGGDAAWEKSNLKPYSNSELRYIDIYDNLCAELKSNQNECYTFMEETEDVVLQFWNSHKESIALYDWLCIDNLKHCCLKHHYGESCKSCPMRDEKVCSGNGKCDGDGTREGHGHCVCDVGYTGHHCDECSVGFYQPQKGLCKSCHKSCYSCYGSTERDCEKCNEGWENITGSCIDIDECRTPDACKMNQFCINEEGSFSCGMCDNTCETCRSTGIENCLTCPSNRTLWGHQCVDDTLKEELLTNAIRKLALYVGMIIITLIIFRHVRNFASIVILIVALYLYISEKTLPISSFKTILYSLIT